MSHDRAIPVRVARSAALLARLDVARHSKDIDLSWQSATDIDEAEQALRAERGLMFEIKPPTRSAVTKVGGTPSWPAWADGRSRCSRWIWSPGTR